MDARGELKPGRDFIITLGLSSLAAAAIFSAPGPVFPVLHTILNTGIALGTAAVSLLFWDLGWRTRQPLIGLLAIVFAVSGVLEIQHAIAALDPATASERLNTILWGLRSGTWAPPAYLLPLGTGAALLVERRPRVTKSMFAIVMITCGLGLFALFQALPRYTPPMGLGVIRPSLLLIPLMWIPVGLTFWRRRREDRIAHALSYFALGLVLSHSLMLYSDEATSKFAITAHFGVFAVGLYLLMSLMQMGTADNARRMRIEQELKLSNEALEARVAARTAELERLNSDLRREVGVRHEAELRTLLQLQRLELLRQITRAIGERQDLDSIFQVAVRSVEDAVEVLPLADGARDLAQQLQPLQLQQRAQFRLVAHADLAAQVGIEALELGGAGGDTRFQRLVAELEFLLDAHAARVVGGAHLHEAHQQVQADREHAEVRGDRELAGGLVRIQHQRVRQHQAEREVRQGVRDSVLTPSPPESEPHRDPHQRNQQQRRADDSQAHRRRVARQRLEQREQPETAGDQHDGEHRLGNAGPALDQQRGAGAQRQ